MTDARLEIVSAGAYASIQDAGRHRLRRVGVPWSGALHRPYLQLANALVGNAPSAPAIEHLDGGMRLRAAAGKVLVGVAGNARVDLVRGGETLRGSAWRSYVLAEGDELRIGALAAGRLVYVAVAGLRSPEILGSRATYVRAGIGRALAAGDRLTVTAGETGAEAEAKAGGERRLPGPPPADDGPIRVVLGPQAGHFGDAALRQFLASEYVVTREADRMGVRLGGDPLAHRTGTHREIVSDATVPGSIQVPGNGQPIVLLADAQTAGGYPKIATVISADLARVADTRPGSILRFQAVAVTAAERLARDAAARTQALIDSIRPAGGEGGGPDLAALYAGNLVGGVIDALSSDYCPLTEAPGKEPDA